MHGPSAALRYFKKDFPTLKWSTVNDWKNAIIIQKRIDASQDRQTVDVVELVSKKRGRPSTLPEDITSELMEYIQAICDNGGIVNTAIVIATGTGMLKLRDPSLLECNGGYVTFKKSWAKYLLCKMHFVKRKATTKCKIEVKNFEQLKEEFLTTIKAVVMFKDISDELIINWDQTGIKYI